MGPGSAVDTSDGLHGRPSDHAEIPQPTSRAWNNRNQRRRQGQSKRSGKRRRERYRWLGHFCAVRAAGADLVIIGPECCHQRRRSCRLRESGAQSRRGTDTAAAAVAAAAAARAKKPRHAPIAMSMSTFRMIEVCFRSALTPQTFTRPPAQNSSGRWPM